MVHITKEEQQRRIKERKSPFRIYTAFNAFALFLDALLYIIASKWVQEVLQTEYGLLLPYWCFMLVCVLICGAGSQVDGMAYWNGVISFACGVIYLLFPDYWQASCGTFIFPNCTGPHLQIHMIVFGLVCFNMVASSLSYIIYCKITFGRWRPTVITRRFSKDETTTYQALFVGKEKSNAVTKKGEAKKTTDMPKENSEAKKKDETKKTATTPKKKDETKKEANMPKKNGKAKNDANMPKKGKANNDANTPKLASIEEPYPDDPEDQAMYDEDEEMVVFERV
uniref:MARVEL domain-containing protein n=1 Tax=Panagrellus redivivus TaxID=6233 RepID=A0A7E4UW51_PANRE